MESARLVKCPKCGLDRVFRERCKPCNKAYRVANAEKINQRSREWYAANKDHHHDLVTAWRKAHPDECREMERLQRERDADTRSEYVRELRLSKLEHYRAVEAAWRAANPEKQAAKDHKRRSSKMNSPGHYTADDWNAIVSRQKKRCASCGSKCRLTVDHIIPLSRGGSNLAVNIQGLCSHCNYSKATKVLPDTQFSLFDNAAMFAASKK